MRDTASIYFQVDLLPQVIALLKRGLEGETNKTLQRNITMQLKGLEDEAKIAAARLERDAKEAAERAKQAKSE